MLCRKGTYKKRFYYCRGRIGWGSWHDLVSIIILSQSWLWSSSSSFLIIVTEVVGAWMPLVSWSHSWPRLKNFSFWSFQPRSSAYSFIIKGRRNKTFFETRWDTFTWNLLILSEEEKTCWALFDPFFLAVQNSSIGELRYTFWQYFDMLWLVVGGWIYCLFPFKRSTSLVTRHSSQSYIISQPKAMETCKSWFHNIFTN